MFDENSVCNMKLVVDNFHCLFDGNKYLSETLIVCNLHFQRTDMWMAILVSKYFFEIVLIVLLRFRNPSW